LQLDLLIQAISGTCAPLLEAMRAGDKQPPLGLRRSARLPLLAALYRQFNRPILFVTDRYDHTLTALDELALWAPEIPRLLFPEPAPLFYEEAAWGENTRRDRLTALTRLAAYHVMGFQPPASPPLVVASVRALMTRTIPRRDFLKATRTLRRGQTISIDELARACVGLGYEPVNTVIGPGQFARRGGLLDLWPSAEAQPLRLEFFGDEIDTMRAFDPASQRTLKQYGSDEGSRLLVPPAREYLPRPEMPFLEEGKSLSEFYIPLLHPTPASLLDYLPRNGLVVIDDRQVMEDTISEIEEQAVTARQEAQREGVLPDDFPAPYLSLSEMQDALESKQALELGYPAAGDEGWPEVKPDQAGELDHHLADCFSAQPRFGGRLKQFMDFMGERYLSGDRLVVVSRQAARLQELWDDQKLTNGAPPPVFVEGSLSEGWKLDAGDGGVLHLLTDGEIFGWRRPEPRRRPRPVAEAPESGYSDLHTGDYVVHVDHGIGRFQGLVQRMIEGVEREYLCIEFADDAQLFVPIHQADRLTRYVGPDSRAPGLSRLGSPEWKSVKAHVKEAVQAVAEDLLDLYARRSVVEGYTFGPDNAWQQELEASFPYIETDDQMRVIGEVKRDMMAMRPMDRLICGDVGYGKTEVALRAAFKAVMDSKQVAILVPTTVLAQQHYNTFAQRLAAYPVTVEMLSRFRSAQQQREIVNRIQDGQVDIVIGTHRMLSSDVVFKDLGLLIIDEEQRFGVTHKEALKQLRTEVDVLTLTATPIPRTLYMALSGVRDISTINTPPEERLPIITHVGPYSPRLVKQAIQREVERGGQVFFVHNRVQTIGAMLGHLKQLVPDARIAIGHGQMPEHELEKQMEAFTDGDVDVLLCTTIIESGLDIPNANTLIVDRADTFGLAQLYQLRGRVGRGAQRAYAYFFRHNKKLPSLEGRQRLETIAENTQLGAGFNIAMRDLEIRGTGDILGTRQSGHIAAVGFHLYTALLAEAVRKLRRTQGLPEGKIPLAINLQLTPVNVELPLQAGLPADYVPDKTVRLGLYRRMADLRSMNELDALGEEFKDRFGPSPEQVQNLFYQLKVKLLAEQADLASLVVETSQIVLRFDEGDLPADLPDLGPHVRAGKVALWFAYKESPDWPAELLDVLNKLARRLEHA
jgi:transcription-repair coupling factor (superfamily II helicase)